MMIFVYLPSRYSLLFKRPITFAQCSHVPASYEARSHRRLGPVIVAINKDVASGKSARRLPCVATWMAAVGWWMQDEGWRWPLISGCRRLTPGHP